MKQIVRILVLAIGVSTMSLCAEQDYQRSPVYAQMVEEMQSFKPVDFRPPSTNSPIIGHWSNRKDGFNKTTLSMHDDGIGILGAAVAGIPFFWRQDAGIIRVILPDSPDVSPEFFGENLIYDPKLDTLVLGPSGTTDKSRILYREGKRYGPYSDQKVYIPDPHEEIIPFKALRKDANGEYHLSDRINHPELAFALISILGSESNSTIETHVDAFRALLAVGISPGDGWRRDGVVSRGVLASVVVTAIGNPDAIDVRNVRECLEYLHSKGCALKSVDESINFILETQSTSGSYVLRNVGESLPTEP